MHWKSTPYTKIMSSYENCSICGKPHPPKLRPMVGGIINCSCCGKRAGENNENYVKNPQIWFIGDPLCGYFYCNKCEYFLDAFLVCREKVAIATIPDDLLPFFDSCIVGKELNVKRSSGKIEAGWKITRIEFWADSNKVNIVVKSGCTEKNMPIKELADVNK